MEKPKSLTLILRTADNSMTIDFKFDDEKPRSDRDEKIVKIMEQFSRLSPEKQEEVLKFTDYLEKGSAGKAGPGPSTS
jgi:hypothetical protein